MYRSVYTSAEFRSIFRKLESGTHIIELDDSSWRIWLEGSRFKLEYKEKGGTDWKTIGWTRVARTEWCCGVVQLGDFHGWSNHTPVPEVIQEEYIKCIRSYCKWFWNKGVIQAWFFRYRQKDSKYQSPQLLDLLTKGGFKRIGRETFNPNSGNMIRCYQSKIDFRGGKRNA